MSNYYDLMTIPKILKIFKIKNIIISGFKNEKILNELSEHNVKTINKNPLNELVNLKDYDAIFIDDDANWYTLFNELKIIKDTNKEFPLVFICNNKFPNKRRDSYVNPEVIPKQFRQEYTTRLPLCYKNEKITISDGFFHACEENTAKNGVLTAIEDFTSQNKHIGIMNINFIDEITILYPKSQINQKRIEIIINNNRKIGNMEFPDKIIENNLLISYINKNNVSDTKLDDLEIEISKKDSMIKNYEYEIKKHNNELNYKNSQINNLKSELSLKESEIQNIESKLVNRDNKINTFNKTEKELKNEIYSLNQKLKEKSKLNENKESQIALLNTELEKEKRDRKNKERAFENQITISNSQINLLKNSISEKESIFTKKELEFNKKIKENTYEINTKNSNIKQKDNELKNKENELTKKESQLNDLQNQLKNNSENILSLKNDLNKKEELFNKKEAQLKNELNNNAKEINTKNSEIEDKNNQLKNKLVELSNKEKELDSLKHCYTKQLSKIENKEYCISCFKDEILNNRTEIRYLKNNNLTKKILSPLGYLYMLAKSKPNEISLNMNLYNTLKDSECFDIGFYLNNNKDLIESKWYKYFSLELHYVCNGFAEKRTFNKKYFNRTSKKELLEYLLTYEK